MDVARLRKFCAAQAGAEVRLHGAPANILVYSIGEKTFAYFKTSEPERWRFSFKVSPERFLELTDIPGIRPARWLGRHRWVTVVDVRTLPDAYLRELVQWSYRHALGKLSRARQAALAGAALPVQPRALRGNGQARPSGAVGLYTGSGLPEASTTKRARRPP